MNYENVFDFGKDVDILTIEIENVNTEALDALEKKDQSLSTILNS